MRFFNHFLLGAAALAATAYAQSSTLFFNAPFHNVTIAHPFVVTYESPMISSPVTITLRRGDPNNLSTISTLTTTATGGSYTWTPSRSLVPAGDYALQISQGDQTNYLGPITVLSGAAHTLTATPLSTVSPLSTLSSEASGNSTSQTTKIKTKTKTLHSHSHKTHTCIATGTASCAPLASANSTVSPTYTAPARQSGPAMQPLQGGAGMASGLGVEGIVLAGLAAAVALLG